VELNPNLTEAYGELGEILISQKNYESALDVLNIATEKMPDNGRMQYYLGIALENTGQAEQALVAYQEATELSPDDAGRSGSGRRVYWRERPAPWPCVGRYGQASPRAMVTRSGHTTVSCVQSLRRR